MKDYETRIVEINIHFDRRVMAGAALFFAVLACITILAWGGASAVAAGDQAPSASGLVRLRYYYLTVDMYNGSEPMDVCADGYHMASLWEIYDPTNLSYNINLGATSSDSGFGPPTTVSGWVRTGYAEGLSNQDSSGSANCDAWTTDDPGLYGSVARLQPDWDNDYGPYLFPHWQTLTYTCETPTPVWCVENTVQSEVFLPLVVR